MVLGICCTFMAYLLYFVHLFKYIFVQYALRRNFNQLNVSFYKFKLKREGNIPQQYLYKDRHGLELQLLLQPLQQVFRTRNSISAGLSGCCCYGNLLQFTCQAEPTCMTSCRRVDTAANCRQAFLHLRLLLIHVQLWVHFVGLYIIHRLKFTPKYYSYITQANSLKINATQFYVTGLQIFFGQIM